MKMAAPTASKAATLGCNNKPAFPELDFRSGARVEELNKLIQEFTRHDQREYDDQRALEIHTAKDFIFSMLVGSQQWCPPSRMEECRSLHVCIYVYTMLTPVGTYMHMVLYHRELNGIYAVFFQVCQHGVLNHTLSLTIANTGKVAQWIKWMLRKCEE
ncbi:hypothetical protein STEG23_011873 [Scotinomys teguina]